MRKRLRYHLMESLVSRARGAHAALATLSDSIDQWTGLALNMTLSDEEKEALSVKLYDDAFVPSNDLDGLYDWEERWFARRLPESPARILVGGAGAGREAQVLLARGYSIHGLEPSPRAFAHCRDALAKDAIVTRGSYRELADAVLSAHGPLVEPFRDVTFDAMLMGWGSFGHILSADERARVLSACDRLVPRGPILLSIFQPARDAFMPSWLEQRLSSRISGMPAFVPWGGFLVEPPIEELAAQCRTLGRELVANLDASSPYFTLEPTAVTTDTNAGARTPPSERKENASRRPRCR